MIKKIVFLGGEDVSARIEISKKLIKEGYEVSIIGTQSLEVFNKENIEYTKYSLNRELNLFNDLRTIFELRRILKTYKNPVIIHAFDTKPTMLLPIAAVGLNNIFVTRTITGIGRIFTDITFKNYILKFIYEIIQKFISKYIEHTVFQNTDDEKYFLKYKLVNKAKSSIIKSSGIDLKKFNRELVNPVFSTKDELGFKENETTFIMVSRMVRQKGVIQYLEAAKMCFDSGAKINFILVGQLDTKKDSIKLDEILKYSNYVKYLGKRKDIKELLSISDVFVLPTYYREGVPRVLLEASSMGLALLATNMPGCKDVIIQGYNGEFIKIKNSTDLYQKIILLNKNKITLKKYGANSIENVKQFDLNIITKKYIDVFNKIII